MALVLLPFRQHKVGKIIDEQNSKNDTMKERHGFSMTNDKAPECEPLSLDQVDFTLVTQTSLERLWLLEEHCQRWGPHPISIVVGDSEIVKQDVYSQISAMPSCDLNRINVQFVTGFEGGLDFPINYMRNLAISGIKTSHAFYIDIDFLMSQGVYDNFHRQRHVLVNEVQSALMVPAFAIEPFCKQGPEVSQNKDTCTKAHLKLVPNNMEELVDVYVQPHEKLHKGGIAAFESRNNPEGHDSTDFEAWFRQDEFTAEPLKCVTSDRFEPYLVFRHCKDVPAYPEAFTGRGRNKIVWIQQLRRAGWVFYRVGGSFVTHLPHNKSAAFAEWKVEAKARNGAHRSREIGEEFRQWMIHDVPDLHRTPYCNLTIDSEYIWYP